MTTPSSPDVPFAHFLSSSANLKGTDRTNYVTSNDLQATYSLYPGSPPSSLVSPTLRTSNDCPSSSFAERDFPPQWDPSNSPQSGKCGRTDSGRLFGNEDTGAPSLAATHDSNFFCPATFARYYLDNPPFPHAGGRLSVSKDSDAYSTSGNGYQNKQNRSPKQDAEEIEAYRASFGFSADEIITTTHYVEISDEVMDDSFTMTPFSSNKLSVEESMEPVLVSGLKPLKTQANSQSQNGFRLPLEHGARSDFTEVPSLSSGYEDHKRMQHGHGDISRSSTPGNRMMSDEEDIFAKMGSSSKIPRKYQASSDAEIEYRRGRSLREKKKDTWA